MRIVETREHPAHANEPPRWRALWHRVVCEVWYWRLDKWIPRLVWKGDEIDIAVTLTQFPLQSDQARDPRAVYRSEDALRSLGLRFDTGSGMGGRVWEWDYSLTGPISLKFKRRHKGTREPKGQAAAAPLKVVGWSITIRRKVG